MGIQASLASLPASLISLEENMNSLNTSDDIGLATSNSIIRTPHRNGRPLGRIHTDPLDRPLNMNPVERTDTQMVPRFTSASESKYKENRRESMYGVASDTDISANSATYRSNSSGSSSAEVHMPKERLKLDILEYRTTSNETREIVEVRRNSLSILEQTDSTTTYDEFSINTERHTMPPT
ncbi:hypothetical protein PS6_009750 [Mucor atramentarius]